MLPDLNNELNTRTISDSPVDRLPTSEPAPEATDAEQAQADQLDATHKKLINWYRQELSRQEDNRFQQSLDDDYYDGLQLTEEDLQVLNQRGQPPMVYNVLANSINWICGSEKRGRTDFSILPRSQEDGPAAERKTKYMKYLSDVNRITFHRSSAFEDAIKVGIGWLESGYQDEDDGEPIFSRTESWRNVLWDSAGSWITQEDWRYLFRSRWVDLDVAKALVQHIPGAADKMERSATDSVVMGGMFMLDGDPAMDQAEADREIAVRMAHEVTGFHRKRVRLIQCEYREPEVVKRLRGGPFNGQVFDQTDPRHGEQVANGAAIVVDKLMMRMRTALITPSEIIYDGPSIYRHNTFSLTPVWCFRRGRDGMPYGIVRNLRPIQDGVNKRASKALHILSTNKTLIEDGALSPDMKPEEFMDEMNRSDGVIRLAPGGLGRIKTDADRGLDESHLRLMEHDVGMIQQVGGVTDELMGRKTNAVSGVAVQARQEQGSLATSKPFDNLRLAVQMDGEKILSLVEQFATEQKQFRVTNMRGTPEFVTMNDGLPENDITRSKADFVVSEADWRATMRQAANETFGDLLSKMPPQVALSLLDLWVETMDIENRDELVKRIRAINGQKDPDATQPTPEDLANQQAQQAQQQLQQQQQQLAMAEQQASIELKQAQAKKAGADVDVARSVAVNNYMTGANSGMSAATQVLTMPTIAKVADALLTQAGWPNPQPVPMNLPPAAANGLNPNLAPPQAVPTQPSAPDQGPNPMLPQHPAAPMPQQ